jgi:hypothetical protein
MRPLWIWAAAIALYGLFWLWYVGFRGPLTPEEVGVLMSRFATLEAPLEPARLAAVRRFLEADDGREFFMVNLVRLHPGLVAEPGSSSGEARPARDVLERYTDYFMPQLLRRAGHPAFFARGAGGYVEAWGVEPDAGWSFAGMIRYRSRRDMAELATDPAFAKAHVFKVAAIERTLAFPAAPGFAVLGPRVWVALLFGLLAALGHVLALRFGARG